ncbi:hypothetical protein NDU88_008830 [Pleurodeles waltl]|uniref:Uncharacterized protein n=1 Tax=Pleurodeles waltl TaxID=8319 RepID=A0AAV7RVV1_PLEWA|nr:hypothetical protein NDU88_008830 [Pleurodeles waltl]
MPGCVLALLLFILHINKLNYKLRASTPDVPKVSGYYDGPDEAGLHESATGADSATEDPEVLVRLANAGEAWRSWRGDRRLKNPNSGFQGRAAIKNEDGAERRKRPEGRKNPGAQGAECPNHGREEGEEPDDGWPIQEEDGEPVSGRRNPLTCHTSGEAWHNQVHVSGWDRGREDGGGIKEELRRDWRKRGCTLS